MFKSRPSRTTIELLEARIAPALAVLNPLADLTVGPGKTGADIDLSRMFDPIITDSGHTIVTLHTNFDSDPNTPGALSPPFPKAWVVLPLKKAAGFASSVRSP